MQIGEREMTIASPEVTGPGQRLGGIAGPDAVARDLFWTGRTACGEYRPFPIPFTLGRV